MVLGGVIGVLYDGFRLARLVFPVGRRLVFLEDGLFCLAAAALLFKFTLRLCNGQLRLFVVVGCALGFILYYGTVGSLVYGAGKALTQSVRRFFGRIGAFFSQFVRRLFGHITAK